MMGIPENKRWNMKSGIKLALVAGLACILINPLASAAPHKKPDSNLQVNTDGAGRIVLSWNGKRQLLEARGKHGH